MNFGIGKLAALCLGAALSLVSASAWGQADFPNRPIKLVVAFGAGGSFDSVARILAPAMSERLGQTVVVENRPGGSGAIAGAFVSGSAPDGYTLLLADLSNNVISPLFNGRQKPEELMKEYQSIHLAVRFGLMMAVAGNSKIQAVDDVIAMAKSNPGEVAYASAGLGSSTHLTGAMLEQEAGIKLKHVPFKSGSESTTSVLSDVTTLVFSGISAAKPMLESKQLRAIAVTTLERSPLLPDVPTFKEAAGLNVVSETWGGIVGPAGMAPEVVAKLSEAVSASLRDPGIAKHMNDLGFAIADEGPAAFSESVNQDIEKWSKVVSGLSEQK